MNSRPAIWFLITLLLVTVAGAEDYELRWRDMHRPIAVEKRKTVGPGRLFPKDPLRISTVAPDLSTRLEDKPIRVFDLPTELRAEPITEPEPEPESERAYEEPSSIRVIAYPYYNYEKEKTFPVASITIEEWGADWRITVEENAIFLSSIEASLPHTDRSTFYAVSVRWEDGSTRDWEYWHDGAGEMAVMVDQPFVVALGSPTFSGR